jgi:HTH-type transcriptional regulator/antitoxin HigA
VSTTIIIHPSYLRLIRRLPLHPIRSKADYRAASDVLDRLAVRDDDDLDAGERDYLETLEMLIEAYDEKHFRAGADSRTPIQRLKHLIRQTDTTPADLTKVLGVSQSLVSLLLNGKRELTKSHVLALADHFKLEPGYFL